jgi:hypothetical protein
MPKYKDESWKVIVQSWKAKVQRWKFKSKIQMHNMKGQSSMAFLLICRRVKTPVGVPALFYLPPKPFLALGGEPGTAWRQTEGTDSDYSFSYLIPLTQGV